MLTVGHIFAYYYYYLPLLLLLLLFYTFRLQVEAEANPEAADAAREAAAELALVEERRLKDDAAAEVH